jgi:tetratricopeptide (TPR) repeat protein
MQYTATSPWIAGLQELDRGNCADALEAFERDQPTDDPAHRIWRAEVELYRDRLDEADAELAAAGTLDGDLAVRAEIVAAEVLLWRGAWQEAEERGLLIGARHGIHPALAVRARALVGRALLRRGEYARALEALDAPHVAAERLGLVSLRGVLLHCEGYCYLKLSRYARAGATFEAAIRHDVEHGLTRWEGLSRGLYAVYLYEIGQGEKALMEFSRSSDLAHEVGALSDWIWARNNLAAALVSQGRCDEAVDVLADLLGWARRGCHAFAEAHSLLTLALAHACQGRLDGARTAALEARALAEMAGAGDVRYLADLFTAWADARQGEDVALRHLRDLRTAAESRAVAAHVFRARVLLADALLEREPYEAASILALAGESSEAATGDSYVRFLDYARKRARVSAIRIDPKGILTIDVRNGAFPDAAMAVETVKRFLLDQALTTAGHVSSHAAELLGLTKSRMHDWQRRIEGRPVRPVKSAPARRSRKDHADEPED